MTANELVTLEKIQESIYLIRGRRVMLSIDLASLYGVEPRALIQAVKLQYRSFPG